MQIGPSNINKFMDTNNNSVYVIIENTPHVSFSEQNYRIIGVTKYLDVANQYTGHNRVIMGPVPFFDDYAPAPVIVNNNPPYSLINPSPNIDLPKFPRFPSYPNHQLSAIKPLDKLSKPIPSPFPSQPIPLPPQPSPYHITAVQQMSSSPSMPSSLQSQQSSLFNQIDLYQPSSSVYQQTSFNHNLRKMDIDINKV